MTNAMQLVKISLRITKDVKIQDGRQLWLKNRFRYQASSKIPKLWNVTHTPAHLVCNIYIAIFLSFHVSLVVVMHFGAGNVLHGIEISMFWFDQTLFYTHIQRYTAAAGTKSCKTMQTIFSRNLLCQGLRNCKIGKSAIMLGRTATSIAHDFLK